MTVSELSGASRNTDPVNSPLNGAAAPSVVTCTPEMGPATFVGSNTLVTTTYGYGTFARVDWLVNVCTALSTHRSTVVPWMRAAK